MKTKAPTNIPPELLFRELLETPRPIRKLNFQLMDLDLYVQSLSSSELHDCHLLSNENTNSAIISKCLVLKNRKKAFSSYQSVKKISKTEYDKLKEEVFNHLLEISPIYNFIDLADWYNKLKEGAKHTSNYTIVQGLGSACDLISLPDRVIFKDKPEEWFDIPRKELIDCHWIAYQAARKVYKDTIFKPEATKVEDKEFSKSLKAALGAKAKESK